MNDTDNGAGEKPAQKLPYDKYWEARARADTQMGILLVIAGPPAAWAFLIYQAVHGNVLPVMAWKALLTGRPEEIMAALFVSSVLVLFSVGIPGAFGWLLFFTRGGKEMTSRFWQRVSDVLHVLHGRKTRKPFREAWSLLIPGLIVQGVFWLPLWKSPELLYVPNWIDGWHWALSTPPVILNSLVIIALALFFVSANLWFPLLALWYLLRRVEQKNT